MFGLLKKKISNFIGKLTSKGEEKEEIKEAPKKEPPKEIEEPKEIPAPEIDGEIEVPKPKLDEKPKIELKIKEEEAEKSKEIPKIKKEVKIEKKIEPKEEKTVEKPKEKIEKKEIPKPEIKEEKKIEKIKPEPKKEKIEVKPEKPKKVPKIKKEIETEERKIEPKVEKIEEKKVPEKKEPSKEKVVEKPKPKKKGFFDQIKSAVGIEVKEEEEESIEEIITKEIEPEVKEEVPKEKIEYKAPVEKVEVRKEIKEEPKKERKVKIGVLEQIKSVVTGKIEIKKEDISELLEEFELELLEGDVALGVAEEIKKMLEQRLVGKQIKKNELQKILVNEMESILLEIMDQKDEIEIVEFVKNSEKPAKIMFLGINGAGKCVTGNTLIPQTNGKIEKIKDIYEKTKENADEIIKYKDGICINNPNIEIFSMNPNTLRMEKQKPSHVWKLKTRPTLIKVGLNNGSEITVTPEHPFFTVYNGKIKKIKAEEIREEDYIATPKIMKIKKQKIELMKRISDDKFFLEIKNIGKFYEFLKNKYGTLLMAHKRLKIKQSYCTFVGHWRKQKILPIAIINRTKKEFEFEITRISYGRSRSIPTINTLDKSLAEFVGLVLAEGHLNTKTVELTNKDKQIIKRFHKLSKKLFNITPNIFTDKRGLIRARIMNATTVRFLKDVFEIPLGNKGNNMKIPDVILKSPEEYVASFLMSYIEADGHVDKNRQIIEISTSSKEATEGLVFLLYRLGLNPTSRKREIKGFTSYRIYVSGYNKISKIKNFGFYTAKNLDKLLNLKMKNRQFELTELVPNIGSLVREIRESSNHLQKDLSNNLGTTQSLISQYENNVSVPRDKLNKIAKFLKNENLRRISESEISWIKVKKIEKIKPKEKWVYDLTVENNHNFIANNIIVHNTTTLAKIAHMLQKNGLKVVFAAADTFRAAAIEQIEVHANKLGVKVIKRPYGSDSTAVVYDAVNYAKAHGIDAVLIDTAGRQDTNIDLINELKKMERVIKPDLKVYIGESIGGNAIVSQVSSFNKEIGLNGVILTKIDCDPKGGTIISISRTTGLPILYITNGQTYEDIERFEPKKIVDGLIG